MQSLPETIQVGHLTLSPCRDYKNSFTKEIGQYLITITPSKREWSGLVYKKGKLVATFQRLTIDEVATRLGAWVRNHEASFPMEI